MADMRDDLHRGLPLGRAWQRVLRDCGRGGHRLAEFATAALQKDLETVVRHTFLRDLKRQVEPALPVVGVDCLGHLEPSRPTENLLLEYTRDALASGSPGARAYDDGVRVAVTEIAERQRRSIWQHVRVKSPRDVETVDALITNALADATGAVVRRLLGGAPMASMRSLVTKVDFEQDLRW